MTATNTAAKAPAKTKAAPKAKPSPHVLGEEAADTAPGNPGTAEESTSSKIPRVSYKINADNGVLTVTKGTDVVDFPVLEDAGDEKLRNHLMQLGLIKYLHQETTKATGSDDKLAAIEEAYDRLVQQGLGALQRKGVPRGPKKADKVAALAAIKGVTPDRVRESLAGLGDAKAEKLLNHPDVLAKVEEMKAAAENQLDLDL